MEERNKVSCSLYIDQDSDIISRSRRIAAPVTQITAVASDRIGYPYNEAVRRCIDRCSDRNGTIYAEMNTAAIAVATLILSAVKVLGREAGSRILTKLVAEEALYTFMRSPEKGLTVFSPL